MKEELKYDPEDIESLLKHKAFAELYPEEKSFVLKHISNEDEYENLRSTLLEIQAMHRDQEWYDPDPQLKDELMASFAAENRGGFRIWLNTLFVRPELPIYRRPGLQLAFGLTLLVGGIIYFQTRTVETNYLAEQEVQSPTNSTDAAKADKPMTEVEISPELKAQSSPTPLPQQPAAFPQVPSQSAVTVYEAEESASLTENLNEDVAAAPIQNEPTAKEAAKDKPTKAESDNNLSSADAETYSTSSSNTAAEIAQVEMISSTKTVVATSSQSQSAANYVDLLDALYTAR
jgi:hypothetical protein